MPNFDGAPSGAASTYEERNSVVSSGNEVLTQVVHETLEYITVETGGAVSNQVVIPAMAGKKIEIDSIHISSDIKETVTLKSGTTTTKWVTYMGADNPQDFNAGGKIFDTEVGEALTLTTDAAGNTFIALTYKYKD